MESEINPSLLRIIHLTIRHCESNRLADLKNISLSLEFVNEVGVEMVDLFEQRLNEWSNRTPPAEPEASAGLSEGKSARQRGRN